MEENQHKEIDPEGIAVTVWCVVYNHGKYLRQALDGFVMQKTSFPFEVLVHDDASTDDSADIIREYAAAYPHIFRPILQKENLYSRNISRTSAFLIPATRGRYVAPCEGDDYWTDPDKLQKQYDFLEANPDFVAVGQNVTVVDEDGVPFKPGATQFDNILKLYSGMTDHVFTKEELEQGRMYGQTCTRMYRNYWRTLSKEDLAFYFSLKKANGDMKSSLLAYCLGKVWCSGDTCAAHRKCLTNDSYTASTWGKNNCARVQDGLMELEQLAAYFQKDISFRDRIAANTLSAFQFYLKNRTKENRDILRAVWNNDPHHGYTLAWCGKLAMKKIQKKIGRK